MPPLSYCREELMQLKPKTGTRVPTDVYKTIRELDICSVKPTKRGHRSFLKQQQPISTVISNRRVSTGLSTERGVNFSNLKTFQNHDLAPTKLNVCLWNVQSLRNKDVLFTDYILEHDIDVMLVTESWLKPDEHVVIGQCTPPGYEFLHIPRPAGAGYGGIAVVFKTQLNICLRSNQLQTTYFESACLTDSSCQLNLVVIYRPPPSSVNHFKISDFLNEFDSFLDDIVLLPGKLLLAGDMNVHWDEQQKPDVRQYINIISSANLVQHINLPTHRSGHILDHVLTYKDDNLFVDYEVHENIITWHHCVNFKLNLKKPAPKRITKSFRNYKNIDSDQFSTALSDQLNPVPESNVNELLNWYCSVSSDVLEKFAPAEIRTRTVRNHQPWYDDEVHATRRERHRAERKWRHTRSEDDRDKYVSANKAVSDSITKAKKSYYADKLADANTKTVFQVVN
ncbi:uncharacterized protein [Amphiura filiformis]|uniref:uncharacterized protein n=1 Tax=Amphiura filiformis TaxID=82378 RepID=UPI003B2215EA